MFYENNNAAALRFGDILKGFILVTPKIKEPFLNIQNHQYNLNIEVPSFSVVLSPCCSIGEKKISLTPLIPVRKSFFDNPYFDADLTRINRRMSPKDAFTPQKWEEKSDEEKASILKDDFVYSLVELFIYEQNNLFPEYSVRRNGITVNIRYYMIDFRNAYKVDCEKIISSAVAPLDSKCLQLSIQARSELRDKLAYYYGRVPQEDIEN
jgi:hypothetical protein